MSALSRSAITAFAGAGLLLSLMKLGSLLDPLGLPQLGDPAAIIWVALLGLVGAGAVAARLPVFAWRPTHRALLILLPLAFLAPNAAVVLAGLLWTAAFLATGYARGRGWPAALLLGAGVLSLYWASAAPGLILGDTGVFQVAAAARDIPHPTGYPLLMLAGHALGRLFPDNPAFAITLLSVLGGAAAVSLLYWWLRNEALPAPLAAPLAIIPAVLPAFWTQAVIGEAYPLHVAFATLSVLAAFAALRGTAGPWLPLAALGIGLGLAHHRIIVLVIPAVLLAFGLAIWKRHYRPSAASIAVAVLLLVAPLLTYLYLPWRQPGMDLDTFRAIVFADRFAGFLDPLEPLRTPADALEILISRLQALLGWPLIALATLGAAVLAWRRPWTFLVWLALVLPHLFFTVAYRVPDAAVYLLMVAPAAVVAVASFWYLVPLLAPRAPRLAPFVPAPALGAAVGLLMVLAAGAVFPSVDLSHDIAPDRLARLLPARDLPRDAVVLADLGHYAPLLYATRVLNDRRDVDVRLAEDEESQREAIRRQLAISRVPFLARLLPGIERDYALTSFQAIAAIFRPGFLEAHLDTPLAVFEPGIALVEGSTENRTVPSGETLQFALIWQALQPVDQVLQPRLTALDSLGNRTVLQEGAHPVHGLYPTTAWRAGERVIDFYALPITRLAPGTYRLEASLVAPFDGTAATRRDQPRVAYDVGSFTVTAGTPGNTWSRPVLATSGPLLLTTLERAPADSLALSFVSANRETPLELEWTLGEAGSGRVAIAPGPGGAFGLELPVGRDHGHLDLRLNGQPFRCGWPLDVCRPLVVPSARPLLRGEATFGDVASIIDSRVETDGAGRRITATIVWDALRNGADEYTATLQVLSPDGRLVAQIDRPTGNGVRPTSSWRAGDTIADRFQLQLPADAPPGEYTVIVALYQPGTFRRLPLLNPDGSPAADAHTLATIQLR